ncbi:hypothetical protein B0T24DRAFT_671616 [Lasiosphaeria ovina]|uniref:Uncharacterized protein n=1 Tax=Lasiosphaeria ovina TaxID=92902 RepID=A0AAE0MXQ8_9PEZI|nr:hypothetical protein B0T24DRAFT_671616 [Lasiosphaeria ovina]
MGSLGPAAVWSPPPLDALSFPADCNTAADFLTTWFDVSTIFNLNDRPGSNRDVSFWVPDTLKTYTTEIYFRSALAPEIRDAPTYGDILQWEHLLRLNASDRLNHLADAANANETGQTYFSLAVDKPARACRNTTCRLSFNPLPLASINGPGMFIFYYVQCAIATLCSLVIVIGALVLDDQGQPNPRKQLSATRRLFTIIFTAVNDRYDGLSVAASTFSLILPAAIIVQFEVASRPKIFSYKDLLLELWVTVFTTTFSVWLYRMGACLRRQNKATPIACPLCGNRSTPLPLTAPSSKPTIPAAIIISIASLGLVAVTVFYVRVNMSREYYQPFHFESFWDDVCEFEYRQTVTLLIVAGAVLLIYCLLRLGSRLIPRWYATRDGRARNTASVLGIVDVVVLGLMSWGFLYCYTRYRQQLLSLSGQQYSLFGGWNLGQVFAISSLLSLPLMFFMSAFRARKTGDEAASTRMQSEESLPLTGFSHGHYQPRPPPGRHDFRDSSTSFDSSKWQGTTRVYEYPR